MLKAICEGKRDNVVILVSAQRNLRDGVMALWVEQERTGASSRILPSYCQCHCVAIKLSCLPACYSFFCLGCVCVLFPNSVCTKICHSWLAWGVPPELRGTSLLECHQQKHSVAVILSSECEGQTLTQKCSSTGCGILGTRNSAQAKHRGGRPRGRVSKMWFQHPQLA